MKVDILVVGCGGTGGCFLTRLVWFLAYAQNLDIQYTLRVMDGDIVEEKNLERQPFEETSIGRNKAVAFASQAEEQWGVKIKAYPQYLSPMNKDILRAWEYDCYCSTDIKIIVGAVDNHACRKLLHEYFINYNQTPFLFYIDAANELSCGEIVVGKRNSTKFFAPDRVHYYREILDDTGKAAYEMSCEELNQAAPQHLTTNSFAADAMLSYVSQILSAGEYATSAPGGIIYFDAFKMFMRFHAYEEERHGKIMY